VLCRLATGSSRGQPAVEMSHLSNISVLSAIVRSSIRCSSARSAIRASCLTFEYRDSNA
jgi:hypothetical protein